jgi:site-specific DNA-methyltransferase (adenine-specific)
MCNTMPGKIHPTQKPIALYEWLFKKYAKPGDKILDTHLGSGSSRIAAYNAGLYFIGYEINELYFNLQEERYQKHTAQENLFLME